MRPSLYVRNIRINFLYLNIAMNALFINQENLEFIDKTFNLIFMVRNF